MKSLVLAYAAWAFGLFGILGFHRFYLGKPGTAFLWMFTGGLFAVGAITDAITLPSQVSRYNHVLAPSNPGVYDTPSTAP